MFEEYLVDLNGTQAAVRAGYSPRSTFNYKQLLVSVGRTVIVGGRRTKIDIGIGSSGNEVMVLEDLYDSTDSQNGGAMLTILPFDIPTGTRISARARLNHTTTPGREIEVVAHGIG